MLHLSMTLLNLVSATSSVSASCLLAVYVYLCTLHKVDYLYDIMFARVSLSSIYTADI